MSLYGIRPHRPATAQEAAQLRAAALDACGCGHLVALHAPGGKCAAWWRYPDVLTPRECGCTSVWQPS